MFNKITYFLSLQLLIGLLAGKVTATEADEVAELKKTLATQQALNQQLLRRLDALESAQAAMSEKTKDAAKAAQLEKQLQAQKNLNEKLLDRLTAVEDAQAEVIARVEGVSRGGLDEGALAEEREEILEEILLRLDETDLRFDLLPTLGGYYDFEYFNDDRSNSPGEFRQHHVSLHLSKEYENFRLFAEMEFEYGTKFEGDGFILEANQGEIKLEQAWGEYIQSDLLTVRGGIILTPGYWNVNHYPNVVLSTRRPLMVRKVYPESFVGIMGYGTKYWGEFGTTYQIYLGNGISENPAKDDDNEGKAVGGRLTFHLPTMEFFDTFDLGISGYHESPSDSPRKRIWGVDTQIRKGPVEFLGEFALGNAAEDRTGLYLQPSYRFNEKWATFYRYDFLRIEGSGRRQEHSVGVNYRPIPEVSLKLEYFYAVQSKDEDFNGVAASIAIAF